MRNADLRSALSSKWDQVVARTHTVGEAMSRPAGEVDLQQIRDLAMALKAEADMLTEHFTGLTPGQQTAVDAFVEAMRARVACILQVATGIEKKDAAALAFAKFLWDESSKNAKEAYQAVRY